MRLVDGEEARGGGRVASQVEVFSLIKKRKSKHVKVKAAHSYSTMTKRFFPLSCSIFSFRKVYATFFFSFRIDFFVKDYSPKRVWFRATWGAKQFKNVDRYGIL